VNWLNQRVVIDTNVWISAALSPNGAPARVVGVLLHQCIPVFSRDTFAELEDRISRAKFDRYLSRDDRKRLLHDWNAAAFWAEIPSELGATSFSRDPDDDKFVQLAIASQAVLLISGDADLLEVAQVERLQIVSPAKALTMI